MVRIYNLETKRSLYLEGHDNSIWSLCYSDCLQLLYSCGEDKTIKLWDLKTETCLQTLLLPKLYEGMNLIEFLQARYHY